MKNLINQKIKVLNPLPEAPSLDRRLSCAAYISARGALAAGISTKKPLMFPYKEFTENDVENVAAQLLTRLHIELLKVLPPEAIQRISTELDEYLSLALGDL
ncbi:hypothetical protein [Arsukibacterium indicum]|uniref:Uncharacterized protein n=1 Tax=Arsukibacterium indicum TaxID=2848612 RepID=A0ABS6MGS3_9GAMM|nr:hypothetical protein [Arsukibacterium indicum]MBV2127945.1 hypothetical protein [Arsukibacterium indicum]